MALNPLKKLFSAGSSSVAAAAFVIGLMSVASRFVGVFRDRILASSFGASQTLDMYYAAFRLPDLVFNLLVLGALSAGFIPVFSRLVAANEDKNEAWRLANNILNTLSCSLLIVCGIGIVAAPLLVDVIAPGFPVEARSTVVELTRIMFLSPFFLGLSSIVGGVLQSFRKFFVYSLSPVAYNLGIIFGALVLAPRFGIFGLAWGVVLGSFVHFAIQLPALFKLGWRYQTLLDWRDKGLRTIYGMMTARTLGLAVTQINLTIVTIIASHLTTGSLSIFNLANNLQSFPVGIFGISFAVAVFPLLSAAEGPAFIERFSRTFRQIMFCIIPATVALVILRAQIVRVILGAGEFNWQDTVLTVNTVGFFALSLFAQATIPLLTRGFYSKHDSKTPFFVGLFSDLLNIGLAIWLSNIYGVAGLALAFSLSTILNFIILFSILRHRTGSLDEKRIIFSVAKCSAAALGMALSIQAMKLLVWPYVDMSKFWGVLVQGSLAGVFGLVVYAAICSLLKSEEFNELWRAAKVKLGVSIRGLKSDDQSEVRGL
jgi:putative peptidoglycan lipid II flippase